MLWKKVATVPETRNEGKIGCVLLRVASPNLISFLNCFLYFFTKSQLCRFWYSGVARPEIGEGGKMFDFRSDWHCKIACTLIEVISLQNYTFLLNLKLAVAMKHELFKWKQRKQLHSKTYPVECVFFGQTQLYNFVQHHEFARQHINSILRKTHNNRPSACQFMDLTQKPR